MRAQSRAARREKTKAYRLARPDCAWSRSVGRGGHCLAPQGNLGGMLSSALQVYQPLQDLHKNSKSLTSPLQAVPKWKPSTAPAFAPAVPLSTVAPAETPEATALDADTAAQPEQSDGANNKLAYTGTCKDPAADSQLGKAAANEVLTADQPAPAGTTDELREVVGLAVSSGTAARAGVTGTAQRAAGMLGARPSERQLAPEARQAPDMLPAAALTKAPLPVPSPVIEHSSLDKLADWASLVGDMELPEASPAFARKGSASLDELQLDCPSSETSDSFSPDLGCEPGSYFPGPLCEALLDTEAHSTGYPPFRSPVNGIVFRCCRIGQALYRPQSSEEESGDRMLLTLQVAAPTI